MPAPSESLDLFSQMNDYTADTRLYAIDTPLGSAALLVESWVAKEQLSTLYEYQITCISRNPQIELKSLIAQQVTLRTRLADGTQNRRSGWVAQVAQLGTDGSLARYRLTVVPWLWLATQRQHSRVFQDQTVLEIVAEVLADYAPRNNWRATSEADAFLARVRPRSYCCQYRETDYVFLTRLLTEEGIGFYFEETDGEVQHDVSHQQLVLFADSTQFPEDDSSAHANGGQGIRFHRNAATEVQDTIQTFASQRRLRHAITSIATWDYKAKRVIATSVPTAHLFCGPHAPRIESYDWAGVYAFANQDEAAHYAGILRDATDARFKTWFGSGCVRTFRTGRYFDLTQAPFEPMDQQPEKRRFTLLGVLHAGVNNLPTGLQQHLHKRLGVIPPLASALENLTDSARGAGAYASPFGLDHASTRTWQRRVVAEHEARFPNPFKPAGPQRYAEDDSDADTHLDTCAWERLLEQAQATGYANRFTAIRADIVWRPTLYDGTGELLNPKPTALGTQTAIVVGPDGTTANSGTVHTDHLGRIRIRYHWQTHESRTCWVRVMQMFAGPGYGAQFIPRIGQEVVVKFLEHDIDRPLVASVLYNGQGQDAPDAFAAASDQRCGGQDNKIGAGASPAWHGAAAEHHHAGYLSGFKSVALGADGYTRQSNQLVFDDTTGRLRTQFATDTATTQLNLGHLIHQADNYRGSFRGTGWELRTDAFGAIRAAKGILITTYCGTTPDHQNEPAGENSAGIALLKQAQGFAATFNQAAATHHTVQFILVKGGQLNQSRRLSQLDEQAAPIDAMLNAISGLVDAKDGSTEGQGQKIPHMHAPLVVVTARAGIDITARDGLHLASGEVTHLGSGRDLQMAVGDTFTLHSGQAIGLLAGAIAAGDGNSGLKLYAGQGNVELQAQSSDITVAAKEVLKIVSANSHVDFAAANSITLATAQGASMAMEGGNITFACPGTISIKAASKIFTGPTRMTAPLPELPASDTKHTRKFVLYGLEGKPIPGATVTVFDAHEKTKTWSSALGPDGHSALLPEKLGAEAYAAVIGFKESVFHFYDTEEYAAEETEDEVFEDEHADRAGE